MTDEQRADANRRLQVGFVLLVAASGALVTLHADGGVVVIAAGFVGGLLLGLLLLAFLLRWGRQFLAKTNRRPPGR